MFIKTRNSCNDAGLLNSPKPKKNIRMYKVTEINLITLMQCNGLNMKTSLV